jgi:peptidoglycan/xylan/chitin deacetylase (PgdA/CDA1 family)
VTEAYSADRSLPAKVRRRAVRLYDRRPAAVRLDRPMLSISFDDAPQTAARAGAQVLDRHGVKGTYFISAGLAGRQGPMGVNATLDEVKALAADGHEIACHTHSHLDCGRADGVSARKNVEQNVEALTAIGLPEPVTFAYPYGDVSFGAKRSLSQRYGLLRALHHGLISQGADLNQAPAVGIEGPSGEETARRWLRQAKARKAWIILYTHDVQDDASAWGCTPTALDSLLAEALNDDFDVVTVAEGCRRIGALR